MIRQDDQGFPREMSYEIEVYHAETGERLGHLGDLTEDGFRLVIARTYSPGTRLPIRIAFNRDSGWTENIETEAEVVSNDDATYPEQVRHTFRFVEPTPQLRERIRRLRTYGEAARPDTD